MESQLDDGMLFVLDEMEDEEQAETDIAFIVHIPLEKHVWDVVAIPCPPVLQFDAGLVPQRANLPVHVRPPSLRGLRRAAGRSVRR